MSLPSPVSLLVQSEPRVRTVEGDAESCEVRRERTGTRLTFRAINRSDRPIRIREIVLAAGQFPFPAATTSFYGEGFQMLSQSGGTLAVPRNIGGYSDRDHYRLPQTPEAFTAYNMVLLSPGPQTHWLLSFTSCHRFCGEFRLFADGRFEVVLDAEGRSLAAGGEWQLEELIALAGRDRDALLGKLAARIEAHHPRLAFPEIPTGWCSWYHYYERISAADILKNLDAISAGAPELKYIQIDDGYQAAMGDWLEPGEKFPGGIAPLIRKIRTKGFQPAIWVAPFIAEARSRVFREHPEWFVQDEAGRPLASDQVTFGGWRCGPWHALDGTHPEVQEHFTKLFRTLREDWGCAYFKLDANFWGALHGGRFHDPAATRIEAYRRGMEAILRGAGDAFVLGCNAPMWPSLGLVHGMRVTGDIHRSWKTFASVAGELFHRNWQHGRLWINDPDCLLLRDIPGQHASKDEYTFHIAMIAASGAMVLAGDDMTALPAAKLKILRKLLPPTGRSACFDDAAFRVGRMKIPGGQRLFLFNRDEQPMAMRVALPFACRVSEMLTDQDLGRHERGLDVVVPAHAARIFDCLR